MPRASLTGEPARLPSATGSGLALEIGADRVVLDDEAGRRVATNLGLPVIGVLGLILDAQS
jgi:predicted nucleic acid-binding protein